MAHEAHSSHDMEKEWMIPFFLLIGVMVSVGLVGLVTTLMIRS